MFDEFKKFVARGNVLDLAVGFVLGAAFGKIVTSFVGDVLMPPIGLLLGKADFGNLFLDLTGSQGTLEAAKKAGDVTINYGVFVNTIIDFLIVAFAMFLVVRAAARLTAKPEPPAAPATKDCAYCFSPVSIKATRCPQCTSQLPAA